MDEAIQSHMKRKYNLLIGEQSAEKIKITIGNAYPSEEVESMEVKGRDLVAGIPKTLKISSEEIRQSLQEPLAQMVDDYDAAIRFVDQVLGLLVASLEKQDLLDDTLKSLAIKAHQKGLEGVARVEDDVAKHLARGWRRFILARGDRPQSILDSLPSETPAPTAPAETPSLPSGPSVPTQ